MRTLIAIGVLVACVVCAEYYFGWTVLLAPWGTIAPGAVAAALALTFLSYALRAGRIYSYFHADMRGSFQLCFKLTLLHNLLNNLLPMRTGELSFPLLTRRYFRIPAIRSMSALLWFRLLDLHMLVSFALLAWGLLWRGQPWTILSMLLWCGIPWVLYRGSHWVRTRLARMRQGRLSRFLHDSFAALPQNGRLFWRDWGWTLAGWGVKLCAFAWVLVLFLPMAPSPAILGVLAGDLTSVLPVHGVAGAGTYEAGVVAALLPFGVDARDALQAAINLHIFLLGSTLIGGALSLVLQGPAAREEAGETERWM